MQTTVKHHARKNFFNRKATVNEHLSVKSISVLKRFASWLDLSLIVNENVMSVVFMCVASAGSAFSNDGRDPALAVQATLFLHELVNRGMETDKKIDSEKKLRI